MLACMWNTIHDPFKEMSLDVKLKKSEVKDLCSSGTAK